MAPFNFKKKKETKNSSSGSPTLKSAPSKSTTPTAAFQTYFQQQRQQQKQAQEPPVSSHGPAEKQGYPQQHRVYPTPPPSQQRNVSGASTALVQPQRDYTPWNRIKLQNSPFPRYRHVASSYVSNDNRIFVIGGLHDESVYGDTWVIQADETATHFSSKTVDISESTPPPRVGHAATLCGNAFVVFGGDTHKVNSEGLMDDDLYLFNINSYKWTIPNPVGPRPLGRYGHKISIIATNQMKTKLYLFGGQFDDTYFNDLAVYDLSSFRRSDSHWEFLKPKTFVPPPLANHTVVSYDHKLWVFGGDTLQGLINRVFMYDIMTNDWVLVETTGAKPPPLQEHAAIIYGDLMCVIGGKDEQDIYSNSVYFLNLKSYRWFKFPIFKAGIPQGRSGHSITLLNNDKILIMGGDKFDYARQGQYDLSTSDTDMGRGTILYTLDLSRLADLCPGIFDVSEPFNPTTPPIDSSSFASTKTSQPQTNILTPYAPGVDRTPTVNKSPQQQDIETPLSKVIDHNPDNEFSASKNNELEIPPRNSNRSAKEIKKPVSPVPALAASVDVQVPRVVSLSSEHRDDQEGTDEEIGIATVASSPLKGDVKYDSGLQRPTSTENKTTKQSDLKEAVSIKKINDLPLNDKDERLPDATTQNITSEPNTENKEKAPEIDVISHLRSELEHLKLVTEEKATEASAYIKQLEEQVQKLTSGSAKNAETISLQTRLDIVEADRDSLQDHLEEMKQLLGAKFFELSTLNDIIKEQNDKIDGLANEALLKEQLETLTEKFESQSKENQLLKQKLKEADSTARQEIKGLSSQIDELLSKWGHKAATKNFEHDDDNSTGELKYTGKSRHHDAVIDRLQQRLNELLANSDGLRRSHEELDANYQDLKLKHSTLSEELLTKKTELEKFEGDYKDTLSSATNASRALEMTQQELQRYKQANKKLKEELEEMTYARESSLGDVSSSMDSKDAAGNNSGLSQDSNMKFARYNVKINDLKAELYIIKQERDNLKDELLELKKKQLVMNDE
ncbi:hypothetical protein HG537_0A01070 [Torulaspora globosa]|uniref:Galactose oxidase n=1 Tax=Torulaspora globosa TaxID=48254 RepID=A0A7H9HKC8_9SACH|nr:hypothetical protein HG537_0A01070 [Torulaspora sp. CBS 2947]